MGGAGPPLARRTELPALGEGADAGSAEHLEGVSWCQGPAGPGRTFGARWPGAYTAEPASSRSSLRARLSHGVSSPGPSPGPGEAGAHEAWAARGQSPCSAQSRVPRARQEAGTSLLGKGLRGDLWKGLRGDLWELNRFLQETEGRAETSPGGPCPSVGTLPAPRADWAVTCVMASSSSRMAASSS